MDACVTPRPPNVEGTWGPRTVSGLRGPHSRDLRVREAQSEFHEAGLMRAPSFLRGRHFYLRPPPAILELQTPVPPGSLSQATSSSRPLQPAEPGHALQRGFAKPST